LPQLLEVLRDPGSSLGQASVVRLLSGLAAHTTEVLQPLREALRGAAEVAGDEEDARRHKASIRRVAAVGLGTLGPAAAEAVADLIALRGDPSAAVRREGIIVLGKVGSAAAVPALRLALRDAEEAVRARAAEALGLIGAPAGDAV